MATKESNWKEPLIRDGFTQRGYIQESVGLYGEVRFSYRPMLPEATDEIEAERDRAKGKTATQIIAKAIQPRLTGWSITEPDSGTPTPITLENVRRLRWSLLYRIYNIITGIVPTDLDPDWDQGGEKLPDIEESLVEQIKN